MKFDACALTDVGCVREHNEDDHLLLPEHGVFIVADGMGGHACGEVASRISVESIAAFYRDAAVTKRYRILQEFFKAAKTAFGSTWGDPKYHVTKPVTIKALIRVCADLNARDRGDEDTRAQRWSQRLSNAWSDVARDFRDDGFYERFAAKGQVERVAKVHKHLSGKLGL